MTFKEFLENTVPGRSANITDLAERTGNEWSELILPNISRHCETESCGGERFFASDEHIRGKWTEPRYVFINYFCRNCGTNQKIFAIQFVLSDEGEDGTAMKIGESPAFGAPLPEKLLKLMGSERDYFFKGRRSETQGLGIAAFAYYRRVVEQRKTQIIEQIIRIATKMGAESTVLADLEKAKNEKQFSAAVDAIQHGIPESLRINGHNPLKLLHSALSEGLHAQTDDTCLELATSIRVVLTELVERMESALKEEKELDLAVSRLLQANAEKATRTKH